MKEEEAADSSLEQQQQAELALTQPRSPEARFNRPRHFLGRFLGILRASFVALIDNVSYPVVSLDAPARVTVPVQALPNELFARSVAFLHRSCVQQAMKVKLLEPFQLEDHFCQDHGSELELLQDIYDGIGVAEDDATEAEEANGDDTDGSIPPLKKCRDCEMQKFGRERCPSCECFSHQDYMHDCRLCDKKACYDCPKSDFETVFCDRCFGEYCSDCKSVWECEGCDEGYCMDCFENEIPVLACDLCHERGCKECTVVCHGCDSTFCNQCKQWNSCEACGYTSCDDCREVWNCEGCDTPLRMSCVCADRFCQECTDFDFCESCGDRARKSCSDFVRVSEYVRLCTDCANKKIAATGSCA